MRDITMSRFTKDLLNSVDQQRHEEVLYLLRRSSAARNVFASAQMEYRLCEQCAAKDDDGVMFFATTMAYCNSLAEMSRAFVTRKAIPVLERWIRPPFPATSGEFLRLIEVLDVPQKPNEWHDEYLTRTILGWWQH